MKTPFGSIGGYGGAYQKAKDATAAVARWSPAAVGGSGVGGQGQYGPDAGQWPAGEQPSQPAPAKQGPQGTTGPWISGASGGIGGQGPYGPPEGNQQQSPVQIGGTNNGGLMNPYAQTAAEGGKPGALPTGAYGALGADPLFYGGPASYHMPTSGEPQAASPAPQGPNQYRYAGSEGWTTQAPGTR